MPRLVETLNDDEEVIHQAKMDWTVHWLFVIEIALGISMVSTLNGWEHILTCLFVLAAFRQLMLLVGTEMFVTNQRIVLKEGWILPKTVEMKLGAFESAQVRQGFLGRMFRGSAKLVVTGKGTQNVIFKYLGSDDALELKRAIETAS